MKIGIMTYWQVANYGAWVQAYALNKTVKLLFPDAQVEHIAYIEQSHWNSYYEKDIKGLNNFNYNWLEIPHSKNLDINSIDSYECDILITGSDSIWEEINSGAFNPDWHLVGLGFNNCGKIISYAPSSGVVTQSEQVSNEMIKGLLRYSAISVRDKSTQELVNKLIGKRPKIVLDPSLLWDFKGDENVKQPSYKRYIAVYGCNWTSEFIDKAKTYATKNNYLLVSIGFVNEWCDVNFKRLELRTFEWLGMIKYADYVFTSTFHGLMVGLSFDRQVKFCQVSYVKNRSQTLIEDLQLADVVYSFDKKIDFEEMHIKLEKMKTESTLWLEEAIGNN